MSILAKEDTILDIYWFHPVYKYYEGEEKNYLQRKGSSLPARATDIPPPSVPCKVGHIYVFTDTEWIEKEDNFDKPEYDQINYTYSLPLPHFFTPSKILNPLLFFPQYTGIQDYISPFHKNYILAKKYEIVQEKYIGLKKLHELFIKNQNHLKSGEYQISYRTESEFFIMIIRSIFDELVQLTYLLVNGDKTQKIEIDCIGHLISNKPLTGLKEICHNIIFGDNITYRTDNTKFLDTINTLFNSIKHSPIHHNAYNYWSHVPNIVSFDKKDKTFSNNKIIYHNHALDHLIFGFVDNFHRIIENQKIYIAERHLNLMKVVQLLYHLKSQKINNEQK